jgi:hypothetical protein
MGEQRHVPELRKGVPHRIVVLTGGTGHEGGCRRHCLALGEGGAVPCQGPPSTSPPPADMLLLKKQTEDISSVYEIREKLGS